MVQVPPRSHSDGPVTESDCRAFYHAGPGGPARTPSLQQKSPHATGAGGEDRRIPNSDFRPLVLRSNRWKTGGRLTLRYFRDSRPAHPRGTEPCWGKGADRAARLLARPISSYSPTPLPPGRCGRRVARLAGLSGRSTGRRNRSSA